MHIQIQIEIDISVCIYIYGPTYIYVFLSVYVCNPQNYRNVNLVLLRLSHAERCARPSLPIGDGPYTDIPILPESRQKSL